MKKNMGKIDRVFRILAALVIGILYFSGIISGVLGSVLMVVSIVFLLTSFISFCPLYSVFGLNTCSVKEKG